MTNEELCAKYLRRVKACNACLHFDECKALGRSKLKTAERLEEVANVYLPCLRNALDVIASNRYTLALMTAQDEDYFNDGAFVVIRLEVFGGNGHFKRIRLPVTMEDDYGALKCKIEYYYRHTYARLRKENENDETV